MWGAFPTVLYFAYTALVAPDRMTATAPGAEFSFIAHLPEWRLVFPMKNGAWDGGLPSARPDPGNTVWGVVFEISKSDLKALNNAEAEESREPATVEIMDRNGRRHEVTTHLHSGKTNGEYRPSSKYLTLMLAGGRHWSLPAGWLAGLEEHLQRS